MSIRFPHTTLTIGRDLIRDRADTILSAIKTDEPGAWDHAAHLAQEIVAAAKTGHVELRHYHESMAFIASPELDEAFDAIEAQAQRAAFDGFKVGDRVRPTDSGYWSGAGEGEVGLIDITIPIHYAEGYGWKASFRIPGASYNGEYRLTPQEALEGALRILGTRRELGVVA